MKKELKQSSSIVNENPKTIYRDKSGRIIDPSQTKEAKAKELEKMNYENLAKWGKGAKQIEQERQRREEMERLKDEPLTRYEIDKRTDEELKKRERFGDPMKEIIAQKEREMMIDDKDYFIGDNIYKIKERDFYLPKCKFVGPSNRFNIKPGYRWDGKDRSNGFEKRYLLAINQKQVIEHENYKWRSEDM